MLMPQMYLPYKFYLTLDPKLPFVNVFYCNILFTTEVKLSKVIDHHTKLLPCKGTDVVPLQRPLQRDPPRDRVRI